MKQKKWRKKHIIERGLGESIESYAMRTGKSRNALAKEFDVQPITVGRWIEAAGITSRTVYEQIDAA